MKEYFLTPIKVDEPPRHTQIHPRCFTCKKFSICRIREDYLKTIKLIQWVLGDPQKDRALKCFDPKDNCNIFPNYYGYPFKNPETIFLKEISTSSTEEKGKFVDARWKNLDIIHFIYNINEQYVLFLTSWNSQEKKYDIKDGISFCNKTLFLIEDSIKNEIANNLKTWRYEFREEIEENKKKDIINTTFFNAKLECDFYEHEKGLTEEEGIKRIIAKYPHGIPCKDGTYYHLATYHIEPNKIPMYCPENGKIAFAPMPYPVFIPKPCKINPSERRDDIDNDYYK